MVFPEFIDSTDHEYVGPRGKRMNHDFDNVEIRTKAKSGLDPSTLYTAVKIADDLVSNP